MSLRTSAKETANCVATLVLTNRLGTLVYIWGLKGLETYLGGLATKQRKGCKMLNKGLFCNSHRPKTWLSFNILLVVNQF